MQPEDLELQKNVFEAAGIANAETLSAEDKYAYQILGTCVRPDPDPTHQVAVGLAPNGQPIMMPAMVIAIGPETLLTWFETSRALAERDAKIAALEQRLAALEGRGR